MVKNSVDFGIPGVNLALWSFPVVTLALGLTYILQASRLVAPAYVRAAQAGPFTSMQQWGWVFIAVAALKMACLLFGHVQTYSVAMCLGLGLYVCWALVFVAAVFQDPGVSFAAAIWPAWMSFLHVCALIFLVWRTRREAAGRS